MDLIYITEDLPELPYPNFTMPGKDPLKTVDISGDLLKGTAKTYALRYVMSSTPLALLAGAVTVAPILIKAFSSKDGAEEEVPKGSIEFLNEFIHKHSICLKDAVERGYEFPPGHPRVGEAYRLHPLAKYSHSDKKDIYIPEQNFDDILFEERESELLSILVNLGAIEVEIVKHVDSLTEQARAASIGAGVGLAGELNVDGKDGLSQQRNGKNLRVFTLRGKPWEDGNKLERGGYAWLNFEPSWNALITAREVGYCTSATLEIKEVSRHDTNREMAMKLKAKIYSANGSLQFSAKDFTETSYIVKVKFS
ncbi:hypothetical protein [Rheinheimera sp. NSM]|uniref:hypothetical protein n=1 Tax=Rheinheimera sp. NSM TaxID=3457884 RepID=UPI00403511B5